MGNIQFQCPLEFQRNGHLSCTSKCPYDKGYEVRPINGALACVYKVSPQYHVLLKNLPTIQVQMEPGKPIPPRTAYTALSETHKELFEVYDTEFKRFGQEFALMEEKIGKDKQVADAFKALQDAENVRDKSPEAYEQARVRYYTLTKGDKWLDEERQRVAQVEVAPVVQQYSGQFMDMKRREQQQRRTIDVVNGVKDKLLSVQDELAVNVGAFQRQLNGLKNMINMERKKNVQDKETTYGWVGILLNVLLVIAIVIAIVSIIKTIRGRGAAAQTAYPYRS